MNRRNNYFRMSLIPLLLIGSFSIPSSGFTSPKSGFSDSGKRYAFCIGIQDYHDPVLIDLMCPRNDAKGLADVLEKHGGFDHVIVMTDDLDRTNDLYPTKGNIQKTLDHYVKIIRPGDMILFSFSGHGATDPSGTAYLLSADTRLYALAKSGIPLDDIIRFIQKTGVKRSIILLDASREALSRKDDGSIAGIYPDRYLKEGATAVFYAARKGHHAYDHGASPYSVFTHYVIAGLKGEADRSYGGDSDRLVSLMEMAAYVHEGISGWSLEQGKKQQPVITILGRGMEKMTVSSVEESAPLLIGRTEESAPAGDKDIKIKKTEPVKIAANVPEPGAGGRPLKEEPVRAEIKNEKDRMAVPGSEKGLLKNQIEQTPRNEKGVEKQWQVEAPAPDLKDLMGKKETGPVDQREESSGPGDEVPKETMEKGGPEDGKMKSWIGSAAIAKDDKTGVEKDETSMHAMAPKESKNLAQPAPEIAAPANKEPVMKAREGMIEAQTTGEEDFGNKDAGVKGIDSGEKVAAKDDIAGFSQEMPEPVTPEEIIEAPSKGATGTRDKGEDRTPLEERVIAATSPVPKPKPIVLRNSPKELSPGDVKMMLQEYHFYATCWNYNGDFCNPDGEFQNFFVDNRDGTVTDEATGLMWQKGGSPSPLTWIEAKTYVTELNSEKFAGYHDWRLPTAEELASIMENSWKNADLFIDPVFGVKQRYCWSMDTRDMAKAWKANFHLGFIMDFSMDSKNSVRVVRSLK